MTENDRKYFLLAGGVWSADDEEVVVYAHEPSSIIAHALSSKQYEAALSPFTTAVKESRGEGGHTGPSKRVTLEKLLMEEENLTKVSSEICHPRRACHRRLGEAPCRCAL
jgi:hypothetical protein